MAGDVAVFSLAVGPLSALAVASLGGGGDTETALALRASVAETLLPTHPAAAAPIVDQVLIAGVRDLRPGGGYTRFSAGDPVNTVGNVFGGEGSSDADVFDFLDAQKAAFGEAPGGTSAAVVSGGGARALRGERRRRAVVDELPLTPPRTPVPSLPAGDATSPNLAVDFNVLTPRVGDFVAALQRAPLPPAARANITGALEAALGLPPGNLSLGDFATGAEMVPVIARRRKWAILWDWLRRQKAGPIGVALALCCGLTCLYVAQRARRARAGAAGKGKRARAEAALADLRRSHFRTKLLQGKWRRARTVLTAVVRFKILARGAAMEHSEARAVVEESRRVAEASRARAAAAVAAAAASAAAAAETAAPPSRSTRPASVLTSFAVAGGGGRGEGGAAAGARAGPSPPSFIARGFAPVGGGGARTRVHPSLINSPYGSIAFPGGGGRAARAAAAAAARGGGGGSPPSPAPPPSAGGGGARYGALRGAGARALSPLSTSSPASPIPGAPDHFKFVDDSNDLDARGGRSQFFSFGDEAPRSGSGSRGGGGGGGGASAASAYAHRARATAGGFSAIPAPRADFARGALPAPVPPPAARSGTAGEAPALPGRPDTARARDEA